MLKTCSKCHETKHLSLYFKDCTKFDGFRPDCKTCCTKGQMANRVHRNLKMKEWRKNNKRYTKHHDLKTAFGITLNDYEMMLTAQNDTCKICKRPASLSKRKLAVDHCHVTGKVRGLLCSNCNTALGLVKDSTQVLNDMINYLKENNNA